MKQSDTYTLIAYKPNSSDRCRGCLMASYSSDFEELTTSNPNEIISRLAEILKRNLQLECNEGGYDPILLFKNGIKLYDSYFPSDDSTAEEDALQESLVQDYKKIYSAAKYMANEWLEKRKIEEEKQKKNCTRKRASSAARTRAKAISRPSKEI